MALSLSNSEKLGLVSSLGTMLSSGIPIFEAVESLLSEAKGSLQRVLQILKDDLTQGKTIADSLANSPQAFDAVTVNLIKAAEDSGTLDQTLKDLAESIKKDIEFSDKVKAALVYPLLVVVLFLGVLLIILVFVIPRITTVFTRLRVELPLPTKILIVTSNLFLAHTPFIIAGLILFLIGVFLLYRMEKSFFLDFLFSLPLLSNLGRQIDLTRFTRSLSLLLSAGIPITTALQLSQGVVLKKEVSRAIAQSKEIASSGRKLSEGFKNAKGIIPTMMIRITESGEKSGQLEQSMGDLYTYFESQVTNTLRTLTTLLEPLLLIFVGLLVGGVMIAIIAPIYGLLGQIKPR